MSDDPEQSAEFLLGRLANEQEANRKLRALLTRAADALERAPVLPPKMIEVLIAELRKAAQSEFIETRVQDCADRSGSNSNKDRLKRDERS
jgi:hypothetical protein